MPGGPVNIASTSHSDTPYSVGRPASADTLPTQLLERLVLYGALTTLDGAEPVGVALALQAPDRKAVDALIEDERRGLGAFSEFEVRNWEFGGRR
jgi:hypothetical protein